MAYALGNTDETAWHANGSSWFLKTGTIAVAWDAHFGTWFGEEAIVFGASLFSSRFDSVGSPRELVFGDELEVFILAQ